MEKVPSKVAIIEVPGVPSFQDEYGPCPGSQNISLRIRTKDCDEEDLSNNYYMQKKAHTLFEWLFDNLPYKLWGFLEKEFIDYNTKSKNFSSDQ